MLLRIVCLVGQLGLQAQYSSKHILDGPSPPTSQNITRVMIDILLDTKANFDYASVCNKHGTTKMMGFLCSRT
jgi:hypothetical protein